jgi:hypothetical protein
MERQLFVQFEKEMQNLWISKLNYVLVALVLPFSN